MNSGGRPPAPRRTASPSASASAYSNVVTRRPPLPPKYRPAVSERKSSLDRCSSGSNCNVNNNFLPTYEDRTPTNDNNVQVDQVIYVFPNSSSVFAGFSSIEKLCMISTAQHVNLAISELHQIPPASGGNRGGHNSAVYY